MEVILDMYDEEDKAEMKRMFDMGIPKTEKSELWGYNILPGFCAESAKYAFEEWNIRKDDVIVATYPKSGTAWTSDIIRNMLYETEDKVDALVHSLPFTFRVLEYGGAKKFELIDKLPVKRRCMITHLPAELINIKKINEIGAKVVCVLRNPKDQMVSWYKFMVNTPQGKMESWKAMLTSGWDKYFEHVVAGDFEINTKPGEWMPEYILSWYKHRDNKSIHFMYFEDLKQNHLKMIKQLAEFLDINLSEERAKQIKEKTSFQAMKQATSKNENDTIRAFRTNLFRKGEVGGWKDYFTVRQSERIDAIFEEKLKDTDIKFTY